MKCPRCGAEMTIDTHRKIPLNMCYECGYIEGRNLEDGLAQVSNFIHLKSLTPADAAAFLSDILKTINVDLPQTTISRWLMSPKK